MTTAKVIKEVLNWVKLLAIALIISVVVNAFLLQPYQVKGHSMEPSYDDSDYTMVWKPQDRYEYGEVVIVDRRIDRERQWLDRFVEHPIIQRVFRTEDDNLIIKRVVGQAGDVLEFKGNQLFRNGELLQEDYIKEEMYGNPDQTVTVPDGHIYVMGDNRNHSSDSRAIGSIPLTHVLGKVIFHK
ncbi:signal peptidase I [Paenibacillus turpanensis]|uniref:signal peptidase I n=1 Tax=Paenibacillus turpanensis TaxID=2689078 RepID=UPI00140CE728|nr:signal peptidase I [Paenibacillus turpanensis]